MIIGELMGKTRSVNGDTNSGFRSNALAKEESELEIGKTATEEAVASPEEEPVVEQQEVFTNKESQKSLQLKSQKEQPEQEQTQFEQAQPEQSEDQDFIDYEDDFEDDFGEPTDVKVSSSEIEPVSYFLNFQFNLLE